MQKLKIMKTTITTLVMGILLVTTLLAQSNKGKVTGVILDESNKPLAYTTVMLLRSADSSLVKGEVTNEEGKFILEALPYGKFILTTSLIGYQKYSSKEISVTQENYSISFPVIKMKEEAQNLKEVTIVGQKPFIEQKLDKTVVNVENSIVAAGGNAMEVLERAPGVMVDKDDRISLRGKQGVVIMIDGKPTNLSSEDVANMLRNMPSNAVETIELITNPSSKYDAAGNAGIINIKLKKNNNVGMNGNVNLGGGYGKFAKYNGGINLNYRNNKLNYFGNYNYSYNKRFSSNSIQRKVEENDVITNFDSYNYRPMLFQNHTYKAGVDYYISDKSTIGFMTNGSITYGGLDVFNNTKFRNGSNGIDSTLILTNEIDNRWINHAYNLNYKTSFDTLGRELTVDLDYSQFTSSAYDDLENRVFNGFQEESGVPLVLRSDIPSKIDIRSAKVDYVHPVGKNFKFETGLKSSYVTTDNNVRWDSLAGNDWHVDTHRTNHFKYTENINAAYVNASTQYKKFSFQLGLRAEHTYSKGHSITNNTSVEKNYINLFPSVHISQKISDKHQLGYSYSRRIDRPNYQNLNPFIYFLDRYTYFQGNPYLSPQYTNAFQVSHTFKEKFITTLGYDHTYNAIEQVIEQNDETKVSIATMTNLDYFNNYSIGINAPITVTKWWSSNNNLNLYYKEYKSRIQGGSFVNTSYNWTLNTNHNITLPKDLNAEISGMYISPNADGFIKMKAMYVVNLGIQKNFWNKKANLKLNVNDVFNMMKFRGAVQYQNIDVKILAKWESRQARLTFTYRFGKDDVKPARKRSTGTESEQNRVNMGGD